MKVLVFEPISSLKLKLNVPGIYFIQAHASVVEDVAWHPSHDYLFGSAGDDRQLLIWDLRASNLEKPLHAVEAHGAEVIII